MVHDNVGYTPYAGRRLRGWPTTVISQGEVVISDGEFLGRYHSSEPGSPLKGPHSSSVTQPP